MLDRDITVVMAGPIHDFLPKGWDADPDLIPVDCPLDATSISRTVQSLQDCSYIILLPASEAGMRMCEVIRRLHCKVPLVLVGESVDSDTLLYSAHSGCLDFISCEDDMETVKKKLMLYLRLYSVSMQLETVENKIN